MAVSFVKPVNLLLSGYSYLQSSISRKPGVWGMPAAISTELTNHCNLNCPECSSGSGIMERKRGFMDIGLFRDILAEMKPYLYNINLYFQGEPMLHPLFFSFLESARRFRTTVSTNGHYLTAENSDYLAGSGLGRLIVSVDGMDQAAYASYRKNGELDRVIAGVNNAAAARKKLNSSMTIEIQLLVNRYNEHQIGQVRQFAKERGIRLRLKSMQVINEESIQGWMPEIEKFRRYEAGDGKYIIKSTLPDNCRRIWFNPVVTWDGKVLPCCFDKNAHHVMGDLKNNSFRAIWHGAEFDKFRHRILNNRSGIDMCRNCTEGLKGVKT